MRSRLVVAALLAALLALAGCGDGGGASGDGGPATVRVGSIAAGSVVPLYLGIEQGFFAAEQLTVEPVLGSGFQASMAQVLNGENQFGFAAALPLVVAASKRAPVQLVAQSDVVTPEAAGIVATLADSPVESARDLEGRLVAVNALASIQDIGIRTVVQNAGGDPSTIKFVELPSAQMLAALEQKRVDAVALSEPWAAQARDQGHRPLFRYIADAYPSQSILSGFFTSRQLAEENPELVQRFQRAMTKAVEYAAAHPEEARAAMRTFTETPEELLAKVELNTFDPTFNRQAFDELQGLLQRFEMLDEPVDPATFFIGGAP